MPVSSRLWTMVIKKWIYMENYLCYFLVVCIDTARNVENLDKLFYLQNGYQFVLTLQQFIIE